MLGQAALGILCSLSPAAAALSRGPLHPLCWDKPETTGPVRAALWLHHLQGR